MVIPSRVSKDDKLGKDGEVVQAKSWTQNEHWFIDLQQFVNVVRYRIFKIQGMASQEVKSEAQEEQYKCTNPKCGLKYIN